LTIERDHSSRKLDIALGLLIKQRRKALNQSQTALAAMVGVTFQQIQKYERGHNRVSFSRLVDIAHALDCRVVDLIGDLDSGELSNAEFRRDATLRVPGAAELLEAYVSMPRTTRRRVLDLMRQINALR
jgi:transcriptional regulator with XRE-family HTH domain